MSRHTGSSLPDVFGNWSGTKAAYRFFSNPKVSPEEIIAPHSQTTKKRLEKEETILVLSDTTEIYYRNRTRVQDLGPMNSKYDQGLLLHPSIAFTTNGIPLGILDFRLWNREKLGSKHLPRDVRRKTPVENKESMKWIQGYRNTCEFSKGSDSRYVFICDREGDTFELFQEHINAGENAPDLLVRAVHDRKIEEGEYSWSFLKTLEQPVT